MHVLVLGANGQLGRALTAMLGSDARYRLTALTHAELDVADPGCAEVVAGLKPDLVINAAAWTKVDAAEAEPEAAYAVNALGPLYLAEGCAAAGAAMVQLSTNEVFAGEPGRVYFEYDAVQPGGVYARSKAAGEAAAARVLPRLIVARVAWLFGPGGDNFPAKIVAAADRHGALRVVADEVGNPTYAPDAAQAILQLAELGRYGVYHVVNGGQASRFDFAQATLAATARQAVTLTPIGLADWPRPAPPPPHAVLANLAGARLGVTLRPWQEALAEFVGVEAARFAVR